MLIPAHIKYIILAALFVLATINFTRTTLEIIDNSKRLDNLGKEVQQLESQKAKLEESVSYKKTNDYIEEKARNDLSLIKPGEKVYVIPQELRNINLESKVLGEKSWGHGSKGKDGATNIEKWVSLFLR